MLRLLTAALAMLVLPGCFGLQALREDLAYTRAQIEQTRIGLEEVEAVSPEQQARIDELNEVLEGTLGTVTSIEEAVEAMQRAADGGVGLIDSLTPVDIAGVGGLITALLYGSSRKLRKLKLEAVEEVNWQRDEARRQRNEVTGHTLARPQPPVATVANQIPDTLASGPRAREWLRDNPPPAA